MTLHPKRARRALNATALVALLAALIAGSSRARAYRTWQDDPAVAYPARWEMTLEWEVSTADLDASEIDVEGLVAAADAAFETWSAAPCMPVRAQLGAMTAAPAAPADGRSTIMVVSSGWAARGFPAGRGATTDVRIERRPDGTARIVEADVYLDAADYEFVLGSPTVDELDLQAVLTHEIGHALGLLHPCEHDAVDAPSCSADASFSESALYPTYLGEGPRHLSADDLAGICALYAPLCMGSACEGRCSSDAECAGGVCGVAGASAGYCIAGGMTGSPCNRGDECASLLCVSGRGQSFCTIECTDDAGCSSDQRCAEVEGRRVCAPPPSSGCSVGGPAAMPSSLACTLAILILLAARRRASELLPTALAMAVSIGAVGCQTSHSPDGAMDGGVDARPDALDHIDALPVTDAIPPSDRPSELDAPDVGPADTGPPDIDGDGVADADDCDPSDPAVGASGSRECSNECGDGLEACTAGRWGACSAPTTCFCPTEGATRIASCGMCGQRAERCTGGIWTASSACTMEGACSPGAVEEMPGPGFMCLVVQRICGTSCTWGPWMDVPGTEGECIPMERVCDPGRGLDCICGDDCHCAGDDPTCDL